MLIKEALVYFCAITTPDGPYEKREDAICAAKINVCYLEDTHKVDTCLEKLFKKGVVSGRKEKSGTKESIRKYSEIFKRD